MITNPGRGLDREGETRSAADASALAAVKAYRTVVDNSVRSIVTPVDLEDLLLRPASSFTMTAQGEASRLAAQNNSQLTASPPGPDSVPTASPLRHRTAKCWRVLRAEQSSALRRRLAANLDQCVSWSMARSDCSCGDRACAASGSFWSFRLQWPLRRTPRLSRFRGSVLTRLDDSHQDDNATWGVRLGV